MSVPNDSETDPSIPAASSDVMDVVTESRTIGIQISFYCSVIMLIFCIFGILGNLVSIRIYCSPRMRSPINILLTGLSVTDLVVLCLTIPSFALQGLNLYIGSGAIDQFCVYTVVYMYPWAMISQTTSVWLMVVITLERFFAVCKPLFAMRHCTTRRAVGLLISVVTFAFLYNISRFVEFKLRPDKDLDFTFAVDWVRKNQLYYDIYYTSSYIVTHFVVPFSLLLVLNSITVITIQRARKVRQDLTSCQEKEHRTALMMVIIVASFATCNTIPFVLNIIEGINRTLFTDLKTRNAAYATMDVSNTLIVTNSSMTCVIYYIFSSRYRQTFWDLFCSRDTFPYFPRYCCCCRCCRLDTKPGYSMAPGSTVTTKYSTSNGVKQPRTSENAPCLPKRGSTASSSLSTVHGSRRAQHPTGSVTRLINKNSIKSDSQSPSIELKNGACRPNVGFQNEPQLTTTLVVI